MLKRLVPCLFLLWILDPNASAQSPVHPGQVVIFSDDVIPENLCDPHPYDESYEQATPWALAETMPIALNDEQLAKLRIELLERGWVPGFDLDAVDANEKLEEAIRGFQTENLLPATGQADAETLLLLGVPIE